VVKKGLFKQAFFIDAKPFFPAQYFLINIMGGPDWDE
jgi:hypothetical protein